MRIHQEYGNNQDALEYVNTPSGEIKVVHVASLSLLCLAPPDPFKAIWICHSMHRDTQPWESSFLD